MSQSNLQTDQARARWAAEYREARKVRNFERSLLAGGASSLSRGVPFSAYLATSNHGDDLSLGRFLTIREPRYIHGPYGVLPA